MKIFVNKNLLESILINLQPFLEKKDATQITSHIYFKIQNDICIIKATDEEIGLAISTRNIIIQDEGSFTTNGKKLLDIIRTLKDEEVTLELIENNINIKQNKTEFKLPTFNSSNYPSFPSIENKSKMVIKSDNLIKGFKKISSSIDNNNPKFELNGALLDIKKNSTKFIGTDTRRLAVNSINILNEKEFSVIIPKKAILEIQKIFIDEVDIYYDETNLIIQNENYFLFTRLINGKYPDYERIIPNNTRLTITLPKREMINSIKLINTISQEIKIIFKRDNVLFESITADNVEAKTEIVIPTGIEEEFELNVNSRYLLDFISQVEETTFKILLNESTLPFILKENNFITIVMPIIV